LKERRIVRVGTPFFDRLDELFPAERSLEGQASSTDFLLHELPRVIDRLAEDLEHSTFIVASDPSVRVFASAGLLVAFLAIYLVVELDGAVTILSLEVEHEEG
jgi:hypothetical protein